MSKKFACDRMLGRLARWLRVSGIDVYYNKGIDRSGLIRVAREEGRTILTRATNFQELAHIPSFVLINSEDLTGQLKEFYKRFPVIDPFKEMFIRCLKCNTLLQPVAREDVKELVPPKSYEASQKFLRCPGCQRIYWPGTHVERMRKMLEASLKGKDAGMDAGH